MSERVCADCGWGVDSQGTPPCRQNWSGHPAYTPQYPRCMYRNPNIVEREYPKPAPQMARGSMADLERDAARYRWLREQIKNGPARVRAQALLWNFNSREQFDEAVDAAMLG